MMAKLGKPLPELHITVDELSQLDVDDLREILAGIDGPKFITSDSEPGARTFAVLISHDKWKTLNHNVPEVDPHRAKEFFVSGQAYLVIPVERNEHQCWSPLQETGLKIITRKRSKPND
jgi:hypothetical protein